ncbi:hypothetical protein SUGI_0145920 [Cryptomeria japonica]|nr:hypothetical protein SUGI_0145920 [Cryptomeria japonica]
MEKEAAEGGGGRGGAGFWWVAGGVTQLAVATVAYRRGCGDALMPVKAFGVASLYVGAAACALGGALHHSGIHQVVIAGYLGV